MPDATIRKRLYFLEYACPFNYLCLWRVGDQMTMLETMYLGGKRKFRRNSPWRTTLPTTVRRCEYERHGRTDGRVSKRQFQKRVSEKWECNKRERAKRERIEPYIIARAIGEERRDHLASRPLALLAYRYFGTRVRLHLTTARGDRTRPFPLFLTRPRRVRRAWQKATNGADSERKECSRRLNWLGNGWFMARFTMADPQSATPPARERREKVREPPSPVASSHASWNG